MLKSVCWTEAVGLLGGKTNKLERGDPLGLIETRRATIMGLGLSPSSGHPHRGGQQSPAGPGWHWGQMGLGRTKNPHLSSCPQGRQSPQ